jgi:3',5'-cyclic-AMP phosphodiesterase
MKYLILTGLCLIGCTAGMEDDRDQFSFVFMTDIHLQPEPRYPGIPSDAEFSPLRAFEMVIDTINRLNVDFVLTGGDNVYDVMRGQGRSDSLFQMYSRAVRKINVPVYNVIGNHELFGIYEEGNTSRLHPDFKFGMYERYLGDTYYSFSHKGWHFIVLNALEEAGRRYTGIIDEAQKSWLIDDLSRVEPGTPVAVALHLPLVSVQQQFYPRAGQEAGDGAWIGNRNEILDIFHDHNLKLVLQGHLHWVEDIFVYETGTRFITGGAVAGRPSWRGFRNGEPPGFLVINIKGQEISWDFIDYGWKDHIMNYTIPDAQ